MPVRTCVGCRQRFAQPELVRFVRREGGWLADRERQRAPGRGAYLCSETCAQRVAKNKRYPGLAPVAGSLAWKTASALCRARDVRV